MSSRSSAATSTSDRSSIGSWAPRLQGLFLMVGLLSSTAAAQVRLVSPEPIQNGRFGFSVDISGDTAVVGELNAVTRCAYVYERNHPGFNDWGLIKVLKPDHPGFGDEFGFAVSIDGDTIAVGAPLAFLNVGAIGAVYVYERNHGGPNNWGFVKRLISRDPQIGARFGHSVDVNDDLILVGEPFSRTFFEDQSFSSNTYLSPLSLPFDASASPSAGRAFLYQRDQDNPPDDPGPWGGKWMFIPPSDPGGQAGTSVAVNGKRVLIGLPGQRGQRGRVQAYARAKGATGDPGMPTDFDVWISESVLCSTALLGKSKISAPRPNWDFLSLCPGRPLRKSRKSSALTK